jgi:hypothetical protein
MPPTYQKVTFLEDIPNLETIEKESTNEYDERSEAITRRYLKPRHSPHSQSGMTDDEFNVMNNQTQQQFRYPLRSEPLQIQRNEFVEPVISRQSFSCQDIYYHIEDCPMCKKFYRSDNTLYLIIIAILIITCALLLKKILNV